MYFLKLILRNALRHKLRTALTVLGHRRGDPRVRPAAHGRRRVVCRRRRGLVDTGWSRATRSRWCSRCRCTYARADPRGRRREPASRRQLVRRRLQVTEATSFRSSPISRRRAISTCIRSSCSARASARPSCATARARSSDASSPTSTASRSATRSRCAGTIYPGNWEFVVRGIYDGARSDDRHVADVLPLGLPERDHEEDVPAPRRTRSASSSCRSPDADEAAAVSRGDRQRVQEFARRDADRNREGVPARLRRRWRRRSWSRSRWSRSW